MNISEDATPLYFNFEVINLFDWENEINVNSIKFKNLSKIDLQTIFIHFPMFDLFYIKKFKSDNGFTFQQLINAIVETGLEAGEYDTKTNPEHYFCTIK